MNRHNDGYDDDFARAHYQADQLIHRFLDMHPELRKETGIYGPTVPPPRSTTMNRHRTHIQEPGYLWSFKSVLLTSILLAIGYFSAIYIKNWLQTQDVAHTDFDRLMRAQDIAFTSISSAVDGGISLRSGDFHGATQELVELVQSSQLPNKVGISMGLEQLAVDVKKAGEGMQKLDDQLKESVDELLKINEEAIAAIDDAKYSTDHDGNADTHNTDVNTGLITKPSKEVVASFLSSLHTLSSHSSKLILAASSSQVELQQLEERLTTLNQLIKHDEATLRDAQSAILDRVHIWFRTRKHREELRVIERNLQLLRGLSAYRERAMGSVLLTLNALESLEKELEELMIRSRKPVLEGEEVPMEVHAKSLQIGVARLSRWKDALTIDSKDA